MADVPEEYPASSVIRDGAVSGLLPEARAFAIHYPGYPSTISRAVETLGSLTEIAKVRSSEAVNLELRFRPEDPYSHPAFGQLRSSTSLLLRIRKTRGAGQSRCDGAVEGGQEAQPSRKEEGISAEFVARVNESYHFEGMVDFQYVLGVHAAEARRKKRSWPFDDEPELDKDGITDKDAADVMMLVPPLFSVKDRPEYVVLNPPANLFSKSIQKGVMEHKWEMNIEHCLAIPFDTEIFFDTCSAFSFGHGTLETSVQVILVTVDDLLLVPAKFNWEDHISKDTSEWEWQTAVSELFDKRPIWPRWLLHERLLDEGHEISANHLKRLLFRAGYYFSTGPYGRFWIRKGYDPRSDPESRLFQKVEFRVPPQLRNPEDVNSDPEINLTQKALCHFQVWPTKSFLCLQLFELDDDFIQQEIRKPTSQITCTHAAGWFSGATLIILRLHVGLRFLSLYPNEAANELINNTRELLERAKKFEPLSRLQRCQSGKDDELLSSDINCSAKVTTTRSNDHVHSDQDGANNFEIEDEEEEEEEEFDGYESPPLTCGNEYFPDGGDITGERMPNDYLAELLRSFPSNKESEGGQHEGPGADFGDEEYQIFEQDSDDDENYFL